MNLFYKCCTLFLKFRGFLLTVLCFSFSTNAQTNSSFKFTFNNHQIKEDDNKLIVKPVSASLTEDRFGNKRSAIYLHGDYGSYLNLGNSNYLKPIRGTIALWFKIEQPMYGGKGLDINPIILTKSRSGDDFYEAYYIGYDFHTKKIGVATTSSELTSITLRSINTISLREWHHVVMTYDDFYLSLYIDGEFESKVIKNFKTHFLADDSIMIGNTANKKNRRYFNGSIDDIEIFNRVLTEKEIQALYNAPNPNKYGIVFKWVIIVGACLLLIALVVWLAISRFKKELEKEKEKNRQLSRAYEQDMRVLKAQMNPHFIYNSLNSIQQFILTDENEKALSYLSKFSRLLRKILESNTKDNIVFSEEIDILNRYLEIESIRFNNVFKYTIEVDKNIVVSNTCTPHFLVQPFVENAIWHGLLPKTGDKCLFISFKQESEKKIVCIIDDNGVGRNIDKPKKDLKKNQPLAISFVKQRLDLMSKIMHTDFTLNIIDKLDEKGNSSGTRVVLTLPVIQLV